MIRAAQSAVVALLVLLATAPAQAAVCYQISVAPERPEAGRAVVVTAETRWATGATQFALRVWDPEGSHKVIELSKEPNVERWRGSITFDRPGTWALQAAVAVYSNQYACFYREIAVAPAQLSTPADVRLTAVIVVGAAAIAAMAWLRHTLVSGNASGNSRVLALAGPIRDRRGRVQPGRGRAVDT